MKFELWRHRLKLHLRLLTSYVFCYFHFGADIVVEILSKDKQHFRFKELNELLNIFKDDGNNGLCHTKK